MGVWEDDKSGAELKLGAKSRYPIQGTGPSWAPAVATSMRRFVSAIVVGVLFAAMAAPAAMASIPTRPLRACCMRGSAHSCPHALATSDNKTSLTASCPCDPCERTLATPPARAADLAATVSVVPQLTYADEFYGEFPIQPLVQAQPQRAPPIYSIQRVKSFGSRISAKLQRWASAVWPL